MQTDSFLMPAPAECFFPGDGTAEQQAVVEAWARRRALQDIGERPEVPAADLVEQAEQAFSSMMSHRDLDALAEGFRGELVQLWTVKRNRKGYAPTKEEIEVANRTARASGAVGAKALVPRLVRELAAKNEDILDFGAGPKAMHTKDLRRRGYRHVTAYDFGKNVIEGVHDRKALNYGYDVVFASNVLNTQSSDDMMNWTLNQLRSAVLPKGKLIANYPESPRKSPLTTEQVEKKLKARFKNLERIGGTKRAPVWLAWR